MKVISIMRYDLLKNPQKHHMTIWYAFSDCHTSCSGVRDMITTECTPDPISCHPLIHHGIHNDIHL